MDSESRNQEPETLDVNTASAQTLSERIPGLDRDLAERIVAHREMHGPFGSTRDLLAVPGVDETMRERIAAFATVGHVDIPSVKPEVPLIEGEPLVRPSAAEYGAPEAWDQPAGDLGQPARPETTSAAQVPPSEAEAAPTPPRPLRERAAAVPPPEREVRREPSGDGGGFLRGLLLVLLGGLLGVLLTLLVIALLAGTLNLASRNEVDALSRNLGAMQTNQEQAFAELDALRTLSERQAQRIAELEPLAGRVDSLEQQLQDAQSAVAGIEERLTAGEERLNTLSESLAALQTEVAEVQTQVGRFDAFFTALRDLLIDMQGLPLGTESGAETPGAPSPTPQTEGATPTPTRTPTAARPTRTPSSGS
ncbi:MAG: helix-hairpin-helix domain-containing protein [Anaerolineae bacterium]